jgi:3-oxoadipate enol-lactonase
LERRLHEITAPATIVAGRHDWIVPLSALRRLAEQIPRARLELIDGADHLLPLRQPERFAELVLAQAAGAPA